MDVVRIVKRVLCVVVASLALGPSWRRPRVDAQLVRLGLLLAASQAMVLMPVPAGAQAEGMCTDTWAVSEGTWQTPADWSTGKVPSSSDVVCIGSGRTVQVTEGTVQAGIVQGEGTLVVAGGMLEVSNVLESSSIHALTMSGGTLSGAATVDISSSLVWENGSILEGSGTTVVSSSATATIHSSKLKARTFINEGTTTLVSLDGQIRMAEGALLKNTGTLDVNHEFAAIEKEPSGSEPNVINTGTLEKTEGTGHSNIEVNFENQGTVDGISGKLDFSSGTDALVSGSTLEGAVELGGATVTGGSFHASKATVTLSSGSLSVNSGSTPGIGTLTLDGGTQDGEGALEISSTLIWENGSILEGPGTTVVSSGATATIHSSTLKARTVINEGTATLVSSDGHLRMSEGGLLKNTGTFIINHEISAIEKEGSGREPEVVNSGTIEKTEGTGHSNVEVNFENLGQLKEVSGELVIEHPVYDREPPSVYGGSENPSATPGQQHSVCGDPISCATGNESETQTDIAVGGRGVGLNLTRTYNSQAGAEGTKGSFGYGWTSSFSEHLTVENASTEKPAKAVLYQADGSTVPFTESGGKWVAPEWSQDTLTGSGATGYTLMLADQATYKFSGSNGRLERVTDRNGNATTLAYNSEGRLESITDPAGRKIKLAYNSEGLVESAKDPMGHVVKYAYESGKLTGVTEPGETEKRWQFKYDGSHELTETIDGRGGKTINEYNGSHQLTKQEDPAGRKLKFEYEAFHTKITNESTGSVTNEYFTSGDEPASITRGYGTASATTETFNYNTAGQVLVATNGDGHTTTYGYNTAGDRTRMVDPDKNETKWEYDGTHDVTAVTTPGGETTTIKRDSHGNAEAIERPIDGKTQITKYAYDSHGNLEKATNPVEQTWVYGYNGAGDRTAETSPETEKRTLGYNEDSQAIWTVSPRGNASGELTKYMTGMERDEQGRPLEITDPLGHTAKYTYDADGNLETVTDGNGHKTTYTYNADNQPTKVKEPNGTVIETEYDGAGHVTAQIDGNKHTTKYTRNILGQVTEVTDPLSRKTTKEYDAAGNLTKLTDPLSHTTTYTYDPANRLTEVSYSDGKTHAVKYEYNADGVRTSMEDGTGTTSYTYDKLDRLTETKEPHSLSTGYEDNLANQQAKITYPNGKAVTRTYDKDGRLQKVTDFASNATKFSYDKDSNLTATTFPSASKAEDTYAYNTAGQMTEAKDGTTTEKDTMLYTRDSNGQVSSDTEKGLPGEEHHTYTYDENSRLTKDNSHAWEYDAANQPTKIWTLALGYDAGGQIQTKYGYTYNEAGERTRSAPTKGPATTYGYDQAGNLTTVNRPAEGTIRLINDTYAYNGDGLRTAEASPTAGTKYMAVDDAASLPLPLTNGQNSYIYGPEDLPIEEVNTEGRALYFHHDQQGSTRLLTTSTGAKEAAFTYGPYGEPLASSGTATTPLGYDGQDTNSDTGLIYLRTREYDPATAQFMSRDPISGLTGQPYVYVNDNPLNFDDPRGLIFDIPGTPSTGQIAGTVAEGVSTAANGTLEAINSAGKALGGVAQYAAPALDVTAAGVCIVASAGSCGVALGANFFLQEILAADQALYRPNYNLALNEAVIFTGSTLGILGLGAVSESALEGLARFALGGSVAAPQLFLDLVEGFSSEGAVATSCGLG